MQCPHCGEKNLTSMKECVARYSGNDSGVRVGMVVVAKTMSKPAKRYLIILIL